MKTICLRPERIDSYRIGNNKAVIEAYSGKCLYMVTVDTDKLIALAEHLKKSDADNSPFPQ